MLMNVLWKIDYIIEYFIYEACDSLRLHCVYVCYTIFFCFRVDTRVDGLSHLTTHTYIRFIAKYDKNISP